MFEGVPRRGALNRCADRDAAPGFRYAPFGRYSTTGGRRTPRPTRSSSRRRSRRIEMHLPLPRSSSSAGGAYRDAQRKNFKIRTQIDQTPLKRALHRICVRIMKFRARFRYASCARYSTTWRFPGCRVGPQCRSRRARRQRTELLQERFDMPSKWEDHASAIHAILHASSCG